MGNKKYYFCLFYDGNDRFISLALPDLSRSICRFYAQWKKYLYNQDKSVLIYYEEFDDPEQAEGRMRTVPQLSYHKLANLILDFPQERLLETYQSIKPPRRRSSATRRQLQFDLKIPTTDKSLLPEEAVKIVYKKIKEARNEIAASWFYLCFN